MKLLAIDISTSTGYAVLGVDPKQKVTILETGLVTLSSPVSGYNGHSYPVDFLVGTGYLATQIKAVYDRVQPDVVVIEETNRPGRFTSRYSQKILEWLHCRFLQHFHITELARFFYIDTSAWRKVLGTNLTKADKALNAKVSKLKKTGNKRALKALGVKGRITKKHVAIRFVNSFFGTDYRPKDNDICDAICQGLAWLKQNGKIS